jgi:DNA topoisomerase-3
MKVCIAEKPSVAGELAKILGANSRKDGYYEGNGYQVTWTFGHLCGLQYPEEYTVEWKRWDLRYLPMIPPRFRIKVMDNAGVQKQFNTIKRLVTGAEEVINCGDAGQEGELIQRWVLQQAGCSVPVKRLWISSLTEESIREGFTKLQDASNFDNLYAAGSARAIGDWLLGMNATRLYTLKYGANKQLLSIGRVQTPTLALIVNRQKEIENFVSQPFWELKTDYREISFSVTSGRFLDKAEAEKKLEEIKGKEFEITDITTKNAKEHPPKLFDLTTLQVECNKKFDFSADETLKIIQSLYEKKLTTYPRVDTSYLPNDVYPKIMGILQKLEPYKDLVAKLEGGKLRKSKKVFDDKKITDHHAIIPTNAFNRNMNDKEKRVYDLVARRFIAVFYPDCKVANTVALGETNNIKFKTNGKQILDKGWREVFDLKSDDNILPAFEVGEKGDHTPDLVEKQTNPPKHFSEATLLRAMETAGKNVEDEELRDAMKDNGIGRPSTRANIIETLFKRKYIQKERKRLVATITGIELVDTINNELLKSAELTGIWEKKIRQIELGDYDVKSFMEEMKQMVRDVVDDVKRSHSKRITIIDEEEDKKIEKTKEKKVKKPKELEFPCPRCKEGQIISGKAAWGCSRYKEGCHTIIPMVFHSKKLTKKQISDLCTKQETALIKGFEIESGEKKDSKLCLNNEFELIFKA